LILKARSNRSDIWLFEVRDGPWLLLVKREDFETFGSGDGKGAVEEIDAEAFSRDVELIVFSEELCASFPYSRSLFSRLLIYRLENLDR
jgi:hypothetical protein